MLIVPYKVVFGKEFFGSSMCSDVQSAHSCSVNGVNSNAQERYRRCLKGCKGSHLADA